jgi:hypothetical protein
VLLLVLRLLRWGLRRTWLNREWRLPVLLLLVRQLLPLLRLEVLRLCSLLLLLELLLQLDLLLQHNLLVLQLLKVLPLQQLLLRLPWRR